ncbi:MAG: hypothetical protein M0Q91_08225 [Methanoregula sp.]|jgi:hypothetical protein|nr:hypothetical protein [Methanoregula sp.]
MKKIFLIVIFCIVFIGSADANVSQYGNWTLAGPVQPFGQRVFYGSAVFHDQMFVIWGENYGPHAPDRKSYDIYNDVWSTTDGSNWSLVTANASFSPRKDFRVAVFRDKLWVIGGYDESSLRNDVWSTTDGRNWSLETADTNFSQRSDPVVVVFDNKLWLLGGRDDLHTLVNDVWSSSDGRNWTQISSNAGFNRTPNFYLSGAVFGNRIFVFDAVSNMDIWGTNEVWSSSDGKNWTLVNSNASFRVMQHIPVTVFNGRLWIVGGSIDPPVLVPKTTEEEWVKKFYFNSVWSSDDGNNWTLETEHAGFSPRYGMGVITFQDKIWVLSGFPDAEDVWYMPLLRPGPNPPGDMPSALSSMSNPAQGSPTHAAMDSFCVFLSLGISGGICAYYSRIGKWK